MPVYIAGAQLLENYPSVRWLGVAFNLTLLSYNGSLDMGHQHRRRRRRRNRRGWPSCVEDSFKALTRAGR